MGKFSVTLAFLGSLIFAATAGAAYVIKLQNGSEFITGRYWQEGRQVMFETYGGVFGIDQVFVTTIEKSDKPLKLIAAAQEAPADKPQPAAVQETKQPANSPAAAEAKKGVEREDDPILKDFDALKERFKGLNGMLTSELVELSKQVSDIKRRIQLSGKSNDYLPEFTEAFHMGDAVEDALKARR